MEKQNSSSAKNKSGKKDADRLLERVIEWRELFNAVNLKRGQAIADAGQYEDLTIAGSNAHARIGEYRQAFRVQIYGAPTAYTDKWNLDEFHCTCNTGRKRMHSWYSPQERTCAHEAALLFLWEKKHGVWKFRETEEERAERLVAERVEAETARRKELRKKEGDRQTTVFELYQKGPDSEEPCFFDVKKISRNARTTPYALRIAREFLENGTAETEMEQPVLSFDPTGRQIMQVRGTVSELLGDERVSLVLSQDGVVDHNCSCFYGHSTYRNPTYGVPLYEDSIYGDSMYEDSMYYRYHLGSNSWRPLCEHGLALLAKVQEYTVKYNPGSITDQRAENFFLSFEETTVKQEETREEEGSRKQHDIVLKPFVTAEDGRAVLSFRLGIEGGRILMVKDMQSLQKAVEQETSLVMSRTLIIDFAKHTFTEESEAWMAFILGRITETAQINNRLMAGRRWGYVTTLSVQNKETLAGVLLDRFYDVAEGQEIDFQDKQHSTYKKLQVGSRRLKVQIRVERIADDRKRFVGISVNGNMPVLLQGVGTSYVLGDGSLSRVEEREAGALAPFRKAATASGAIHFNVGKEKLAEFYYRVVPRLVENPFVEFEDACAEEVEQMLPPEPVFTFYLDKDGQSCLLRETVRYGEEEKELSVKPGEGSGASNRDAAQEERVERIIGKYFPSWQEADRSYTVPVKSNDTLYRILTEAVPELEKYGEVRGSESFRKYTVRPLPQLRVGVSLEGGLLDISVLTKDMSAEELLAVLNSYQEKKRYHRLKSGDFVVLNEVEQLEALRELSEEMNLSMAELIRKGVEIPAYRALYLDRMLEKHDELVGNRNRTFRTLIKNFNTVKDAEYEIPEELSDTMRPYQQYGYKWLRTLAAAGFGGILADEMGLGKTLQMISVFDALHEEGDGKPFLVVCPASLIYNWQEEIHRFAPKLKVVPVAGTASARKQQLKELEAGQENMAGSGQESAAGSETEKIKISKSKMNRRRQMASLVFVTSYDLLRKDITLYENIQFQAAVLDEAQYIKNQKAAMTKAVKALKAKLRFALTGTPIENRLAELWSIFDFLMPGFLYGYDEFAKKFEVPVTKGKDQQASDRLKQMVGPFILRRLKSEVLKDLPDKLEEVRYARFEEEQRKVYDGQVVRMKQILTDSGDNGQDKIKILAELTRLRQICCDPSLLFADYAGESTKRKACLELVESARNGGHRMLIFSQFTSMLELLEEDLKREGIPYYKITGATSKESRLQLVKAFNEGDVPVFLISLKAGGTGLNLTGADIVIHYDPWWNFAAQNQATDRAHRIGQQNTVTVYRIIVKDTIEEKILAMQEAKKDLADAILSGDGKSLFAMSGEELLRLLE
ncbi:MAG: DEAD/DEAH box helicase [Lachnospiraceae bacterium]|nr:DEAD/DEAH box helicase [Lachnospiraceae bacterium]